MSKVQKYLLLVPALFVVVPLVAEAGSAPPAAQNPPAQTAPPPLVPPRAEQAPAPVPFPADAKVAFINLEYIFANSTIGKRGQDQVKQLSDRLSAGLQAREKELQALSEKIRTQQGIVTPQVALEWNKELQRKQREAQFAQQEAQVQVTELQETLLDQFEVTVRPVVEALRAEKGLYIIFAIQTDPGGLTIAVAHPGVDLSAEVVKRLNATSPL